MTTPRLLDEIKIDDGGFFQRWSRKGLIKKRTVIFGRNGSGKSTLVRHLRDKHHPESTSATTTTTETDLDILVFNEDYVHENLGGVFTGSGLSSALFVTGSVNVEIEAQIDAATRRKARVARLVAKARAIHKRRNQLLKTAHDTARDAVRELPGESGAMKAATAEKTLRDANPCTDGDEATDRRLLTTDQASIPDSVAGLPDAQVSVDLSHVGRVLSRNVAADASAALSDLTPEQRSWVEKGAELHENRDTCLLCENDLVAPRSDLLAALRTTEMLDLRADLDALQTSLQTQSNAVTELTNDLVERVKRIDTSAVDMTKIADELEAARSYLDQLSACLAAKLTQPQATIELPKLNRPTSRQFGKLLSIVKRTNDDWERQRTNLASQQQLAAARCLGRLRNTHIPRIEAARIGAATAEQRLASLKTEQEEIDSKISKLSAQRLATQDANPLARQLTIGLRNYLGHDELTVKVEIQNGAPGFALYRTSGRRAERLSDGERTAISLLHFLTSLQETDRADGLRETCVVLDDPVSSLDGQSIRNAFHFIVNSLDNGQGTDKVGQYLVFTHSEAFFGLWRDKLTDRAGKVGSFNALLRLDARQSNEGGQREPILEAFPPGAIKYRSEYYRVFDQVVVAVEQPSNFIDQGIANTARRMMESFARWKVPPATDLSDSFIRLMKQVPADAKPERFKSVLQFLQSGSHLEEIDVGTEAESVSNYRDDVIACLALMKAADPEHFEGMFRAVRTDDDGTGVSDRFKDLCDVLAIQLPPSDADSSEAAS